MGFTEVDFDVEVAVWLEETVTVDALDELVLGVETELVCEPVLVGAVDFVFNVAVEVDLRVVWGVLLDFIVETLLDDPGLCEEVLTAYVVGVAWVLLERLV